MKMGTMNDEDLYYAYIVLNLPVYLEYEIYIYKNLCHPYITF